MTRPPLTPSVLGAVAAGGAVGSALRAALGLWVPDTAGFPWTTLTINVAGSFLLASLPALAAVRRNRLLAVALGPGLLGGFTTLSAYAEQGRALLAEGSSLQAAAYLLGTLAACLVAVHLAASLSPSAAQVEFEDEEGFE